MQRLQGCAKHLGKTMGFGEDLRFSMKKTRSSGEQEDLNANKVVNNNSNKSK